MAEDNLSPTAADLIARVRRYHHPALRVRPWLRSEPDSWAAFLSPDCPARLRTSSTAVIVVLAPRRRWPGGWDGQRTRSRTRGRGANIIFSTQMGRSRRKPDGTGRFHPLICELTVIVQAQPIGWPGDWVVPARAAACHPTATFEKKALVPIVDTMHRDSHPVEEPVVPLQADAVVFGCMMCIG